MSRLYTTIVALGGSWWHTIHQSTSGIVHVPNQECHVYTKTLENGIYFKPTGTCTKQRLPALVQLQHPDTVYPPLAEDLKQHVQYIYSNKKLPSQPTGWPCGTKGTGKLHHRVASDRDHLHCFCPGSVNLELSPRISRSARIITINVVIESKLLMFHLILWRSEMY